MSDDILSGGKIDQSTSGPTPPKTDDRDRNILLEQKERQDEDALGGTQFPPKPQPLPPIPEASEVAPPLPIVPSFDFNVSGFALEEMREISRQTTIDILKNVNINGQGPSIDGSTIAFNIPQQPPASEAFFFQGVVIPQSPVDTVPQIPQPIQDVQSVVVALPSRTTQDQTTQERSLKSEEVGGISSKDFKNGEREDFIRPAYNRLSEYTTFVGAQQDDTSQTIRDEAGKRGADIDFNNAQAARDEARKRGTDTGFNDTQKARDEAREKGAVEMGFKKAESQRKERIESDTDFDRESFIRQRGETPTEFRERREQLRQERAEDSQREEQISRVRTGDLTEMPSGMIPVRFTRADGQKKILALMATELVGVVEGADFGERTLSLPAEDSFYEAGGGSSVAHPWKITIENQGTTSSPNWKYKIEPASRLYDGFGGGQITVNGADGQFRTLQEGFYFIEVEFEDGEVASATIETGQSIGSLVETGGSPAVQTRLRQQIGYVFFDNDGNPQLRQNAWHNFSLFAVCKDGNPVKVTIAT